MRLLRWAVAIVAMWLLVRYVGAADVVAALRAMHPAAVLAYVLAFTAVPFIYGLQVDGGLRRLGHDIPRADVLRATTQSWSIGTLTPARAGDLSLAAFLGPNAPRVDATVVVLVDKVVSLLVLALLAIASMAIVRVPYAQAFVAGVSWVVGGTLGLLAIVVLPERASSGSSLARRLLGVQAVETWKRLREIVGSRRLLAWSAGMSALRWGYVCVANLILFWGTGARPGLGVVTAATAVGRIISIVPVSIGGMGVKEPLQIVIYSGAGVSAETVIVVSVIGMACGFAAAAFAPLIARWLFPAKETA
jgi:uncharacterized membrane protein YbhN (UPF0104 family)